MIANKNQEQKKETEVKEIITEKGITEKKKNKNE
jgi:hypothetical protein